MSSTSLLSLQNLLVELFIKVIASFLANFLLWQYISGETFWIEIPSAPREEVGTVVRALSEERQFSNRLRSQSTEVLWYIGTSEPLSCNTCGGPLGGSSPQKKGDQQEDARLCRVGCATEKNVHNENEERKYYERIWGLLMMKSGVTMMCSKDEDELQLMNK